MGRTAGSADSEGLVERALLRKSKTVTFIKAIKHDELDRSGKDFIVTSPKWLISGEAIQVKTSDNRVTLGLVLPIPEPAPSFIDGRISPKMKAMIDEHQRKHSDVRSLLFVAIPNKGVPEEMVMNNIWKEMTRIFNIIRRPELCGYR
jgi:hypothetical protein